MLNRWDPFTEIARLQDQVFRGFTPRADATQVAPPVDIYEEKDAIVVHVELPGVKPEDVKVSVENDVLTVSGTRKLANAEKKDGYHRVERWYGGFTRSFALPKTIDGDKVEAGLDAGVLTVRIPKRTAPEPRRIEVRTGSVGSAKPATSGPPS